MVDSKQIPEAYLSLQERLNKNPEGAPKADELFEILQILFTEEEALVASKMPMMLTDLDAIVEATGMPRDRVAQVVASLADKGLVIDVESKKGTQYVLGPPVVGFLEYTFMKRNEHLPMKRLAELADAYVRNHLIPEEVPKAKTQRARAVPHDTAFGPMTSEVVTYERAAEVIKAAGRGSIGTCFCRREAHLLGKGCDLPVEGLCMGLGRGGDYLVRHGFAQPATVDELLAKLDEAEELGLVHTMDNVQEKAVFMCHCCGCCCHLLRSITELNVPETVAPSGYIAQVDGDVCVACGLCEKRCQIDAIVVGDEFAIVNTDRCIGCGICVTACPSEALSLAKRESAPETPKNLMDLFARLVQEKGRVKHYMP